MNDSPELTPQEKYHASLYKDPAQLFRRALVRKLTFLVPSLALMIAWFITRDAAYAICGYGILLSEAVQGYSWPSGAFRPPIESSQSMRRKTTVNRMPPNQITSLDATMTILFHVRHQRLGASEFSC
jgi:hypothetical protein